MTGSASTLTLKLIEAISTRIRGGAFEQIAAETVGVPFAVYQQWLRLGERADSPELYRMLAGEVRQAIGWARLKAEMELHENDAKTWLLYGPGRETAAREGWGHAGKTAEGGGERMQLLELCAVVLQALDAYPDIRAKVAETLAKQTESKSQT